MSCWPCSATLTAQGTDAAGNVGTSSAVALTLAAQAYTPLAMTLVSTAADGTRGNSTSNLQVFSPDGSKVAFESLASNLVAGDTNGFFNIFVKDLASGAVTLVSTAADGTLGNSSSTTPVWQRRCAGEPGGAAQPGVWVAEGRRRSRADASLQGSSLETVCTRLHFLRQF